MGAAGPRRPSPRTPGHTPSVMTEAIERQNRALRELSHRAFPDTDAVPDDAPTPFDAARSERRRQDAETEAAALHRVRVERADRDVVPRRLEQTA